MSDGILAAAILACPLTSISFAIWKLANILRSGEVSIRNRINIDIKYPKNLDVEVNVNSKKDKEIS